MPRQIDPSIIKKGSGMANQDSVDANAFVDEVVEGSTAIIAAHLKDPKGAHPASAISTTGSGGQFFTTNVQGNLDELSTILPFKPPGVGVYLPYMGILGIPDWGVLKLRDAGFIARGEVATYDTPNPDAWVYPEFWWPAYEAANLYGTNPPGDAFQPPANDPTSDPMFNVDPAGTGDPTYTGGGVGTTHQGGFTRGGRAIIETARITSVGPGNPVVVSGVLFPADRGVLALFHWPPGGDVAAFLAQGLGDRVIAAVRCGQGIGDDCDGDPGGIFSEGGSPQDFPGRWTGQYDLSEIHLGVNAQTGDLLPAGPQPTAAQVRLGSDPNAGPVIPGGIKILGGTTAANGGGNDSNFFRYRLPYRKDYASLDITPLVERPRYFQKPLVADDYLTDLTQAGNYPNFALDYAAFQLARYRHRFFLQSPPSDQGSYFLLHFKREADFEAFARDGIMPDDVSLGYDLWSAGLQVYTNPESTDNLVDLTDPANPTTSTAYHVLRGSVFEDPSSVPVAFVSTFTYTRTVDEVMFASGVQYFLPNGVGTADNWTIPELTLRIAALWDNAYVLGNHSLPAEITPGLLHRPPVVVYLGIGTCRTNIINGLDAGYTGVSTYQRVDFDYPDLDIVSGPYDLTNGPLPGDTADIELTIAGVPIGFRGDDRPCHFWHGLQLRAFARKPLGNQSPSTVSTEFVFANPGGNSILIHTTSHSPSNVSAGDYGNFTVPPLNVPRPNLENERKDVEERFLDEVYRVSTALLWQVDPTWDAILLVGNVVGPGLPFGFAPIEMPARWASASVTSFGAASFLQQQFHYLDLSSNALVALEAQVAGLPDRSPPATSGSVNPSPFSGRLIYPVENYLVGYRPSLADGDVTTPQPDYSAIVDPERHYIRVFDAAYSMDTSPEPGVVGQPFLTLRIDGLSLSDIAYSPPGPGNSNIAILVKIPGLTSWMDIGRKDGDGPSKQDPLLDGAGCQVLGTETFTGRDSQTGTVFSQVKINVGPVAMVFANAGPTYKDVAPVMVKAILRRNNTLDFTQGGPSSPTSTPRALVGVSVLRHSTTTGPLPFPLPPFP